MSITTIGIDLAKSVFVVHGVDEHGQVLLRQALKRAQVLPFFAKLERCTIGMEACGGAHDWARRLIALGHDVRLMPAAYVKPYVKRSKTDAGDAEAICEAVTRPTMRFVPVKSLDQQGVIALHRTRGLLVRQKVQTENAIRAICNEFGLVALKGAAGIVALRRLEAQLKLPAPAQRVLGTLFEQYARLAGEIAALKEEIVALVRADQVSRRLMGIPGVGPIIASAVPAVVGDASRFKSARHFSAWLGLTPRIEGSGGKNRRGAIAKRGDRYLRSLFVEGACALLIAARRPNTKVPDWVTHLAARKNFRVAAIAIANRIARITWALMVKGGFYRNPKLPASIESAAA